MSLGRLMAHRLWSLGHTTRLSGDAVTGVGLQLDHPALFFGQRGPPECQPSEHGILAGWGVRTRVPESHSGVHDLQPMSPNAGFLISRGLEDALGSAGHTPDGDDIRHFF